MSNAYEALHAMFNALFYTFNPHTFQFVILHRWQVNLITNNIQQNFDKAKEKDCTKNT
jgi:hypothetical protein